MPVAWFDPPPTASLVSGDDVVVVGSVRRRFFRVGGSTQSRTEVVAQRVLRPSQRRQVTGALAEAVEGIQGG